jgi:2-polyprenyl-3-methyl-5-hydroxy-6-metoxy-1,4-benzoquinol methylase
MSVRAFYDTLAPHYDAVRFATPYARVIDRLERSFIREHVHPGSVLELGAGTGRLTTTLAALAPRVTVVDESEPMLAALRARLQDSRHVRAQHMNMFRVEELPEFGRFDTVVCFRMLPHVEDTARALSLIRRALRPGGRAIFDLWNSRSATYVLRTAARRGRVYTRFMSPGQMRNAITAAGLRVEACRGWGMLTPLRVLQGRLDEARLVRLFDLIERLGTTRLRGVAHALMFSCVNASSPS